MEDIRRKCNQMVNLSQFTSKKKKNIYIYIEWSDSHSLQSSLLPNFVQKLFMLSLKNFRVVTNIF